MKKIKTLRLKSGRVLKASDKVRIGTSHAEGSDEPTEYFVRDEWGCMAEHIPVSDVADVVKGD